MLSHLIVIIIMKMGRVHWHNRGCRHNYGRSRGSYRGQGHNKNYYYQSCASYKNHRKGENDEGIYV